jgi:hypothetical protein
MLELPSADDPSGYRYLTDALTDLKRHGFRREQEMVRVYLWAMAPAVYAALYRCLR